MKSFIDLAKKRYSVRHFSTKPVEKEKILQILEAARIAPSAANRQPWEFVVLDDREIKLLITVTYNKSWLREAPAIIVVCGNHKSSWIRKTDGKDHCDIDIAITIDHLTLAATEEGLGTCWICAFDAKKVSEFLELPSHIEPIALIPIGYPSDQPNLDRHETLRKSMDEIVHWNKYMPK